MLQYESGTREGDIVTIHTRITPRFFDVGNGSRTRTSCLGMHGFFDQYPSVMPAGTVRFYDGEREVTERIGFVDYFPAGQIQPNAPPERICALRRAIATARPASARRARWCCPPTWAA